MTTRISSLPGWCFLCGGALGLLLTAAPMMTAAPALPAVGSVVELPPLIVVEKVDALRWRYLGLPDLEAIAVCSDEMTRTLLERHYRLHELLLLIVPRQLQPEKSVRETYIFFNEQLGRIAGQEVVADALRGRSGNQVRFTPNLRMSDLDAQAVFVIVQEHQSDLQSRQREVLYFAPERIAAMLRSRTPALPSWFVTGTLGLYASAEFGEDDITIKGAEWTSPDETQALRRDVMHPRVLLPIEELLSHSAIGEVEKARDELTRIWRAQCTLFVRWAVAHRQGERRDALWAFVERNATEPPSEALFRECFGMGFADMRDQLSDYLPVALSETVTLKPTKLLRPPPMRLRPATRGEVARIRGDWERMQIRYVQARYPELVPKYSEQALRTLRRAYSDGERDGELLAVLGLAELEGGAIGAAEKFLDAATKAGVKRPRAWYELARLRYTRARTAGAGSLGLEEGEGVLTLLERTRALQPPLAAAYGLAAETWLHRAEVPSADDLKVIEEGARLFAGNPALVLAAVHLLARAGAIERAAVLVELGLRHAPDQVSQEKFVRLVEVVRANKSE